MNIKQLKNQLATNLKLRPKPILKDRSGRLQEYDVFWHLESITKNPKTIVLTSIGAGYHIRLQTDNIKEYRTPYFLILRCSLLITKEKIEIEPVF